MKRYKLLSSASAPLLKSIAVCFVLLAASSSSSAQTRPVDERARAQSTAATTADEEFELNIDEQRIVEKDFHAETAVETSGAGGLHLGVGVALRASEIEVLLRNVRGRVRFRGSLAPVLRLLDARRGVTTRTPPP